MPTARIVFRQDVTANWENANPVLLKGEMGVEYADNGTILFKLGDGTQDPDTGMVTGTPWNNLPYASGIQGPPPKHEWNKGNLRFQNQDGSWGEFESLIGPQGQDGAVGPAGPRPDHEWNGFEIRFQKPDGSWGDYVNIRGQVGPQGLKGDKGEQGVPGPPYTLPPATKTQLGGIKVGKNLTITLDGCLSAADPFYVPLGGIVAYNGKFGTGDNFRHPMVNNVVDKNWVVCDGVTTNGVAVPNLSNRFIRDCSNNYDLIGRTGGSNTHRHTVFTEDQGNPAGTPYDPYKDTRQTTLTGIAAANMPSHNHYVHFGKGWLQHNEPTPMDKGLGFNSIWAVALADGRYNPSFWGYGIYETSEAPHDVNGNPNSIGSAEHQHWLWPQNTSLIDHTPPYMWLAYIIRVK